MKILSPSFHNGQPIPRKYTCQGEEISPPFIFENIPEHTQSLVLIMEDPDVPTTLRADGMWDHWVLSNILPTVQKIEENKPPLCKMGMTTSKTQSYVGPCPPDREHRYFFKLFALDTMLSLPSGAAKSDVEKAMQGHVIAKAELMGTYHRMKHHN